MAAEVEKFDPPATKISMLATHIKSPTKPTTKYTSQQQALTVRAVELRDPKKDGMTSTTASTSNSSYRCGICNMRNHITSVCRFKKKEGCWHYGGKHLLRDCRAPFARASTTTSQEEREKARSAMLAIISKIPEEDEIFELVYPVRVNGSHVIAVANIDTDAQCSANTK